MKASKLTLIGFAIFLLSLGFLVGTNRGWITNPCQDYGYQNSCDEYSMIGLFLIGPAFAIAGMVHSKPKRK